MKINWAEVFAAMLSSLFTHSLSVRLGNGTLTAAAGTTKVPLSANMILAAAAMAYAGVQATLPVGSVVLTYTPDAAPTTPAW
jgi:uncharacterized protein (DUF111 family)